MFCSIDLETRVNGTESASKKVIVIKMKAYPRVSICIPTYNQAQYLDICLNSALTQSLIDIEIVVSDNHSTDDTAAILQKHSDPRLKVVKPEKFLDMFDHFNFCVSKSSGKYFCILSSDDVLFPDFAKQHAMLLDNNENVVFSHTATEVIDKNGQTIGLEKSVYPSFIRSGMQEIRRYIYGPKCVLCSAMIRRRAFDEVGGFSPYKIVGDWDLWLRLLQVGDVAYNDRVLCKYRVWNDQPGHRQARVLMHLEEVANLYSKCQDMVADRCSELAKVLMAAREKHALSAITGLTGYDSSIRNEAKKYILMVSPSWHVRYKLILFDLGLGPIWEEIGRFKSWLRPIVKGMLYPKQ